MYNLPSSGEARMTTLSSVDRSREDAEDAFGPVRPRVPRPMPSPVLGPGRRSSLPTGALRTITGAVNVSSRMHVF